LFDPFVEKHHAPLALLNRRPIAGGGAAILDLSIAIP
jgi:hypothetical protein